MYSITFYKNKEDLFSVVKNYNTGSPSKALSIWEEENPNSIFVHCIKI